VKQIAERTATAVGRLAAHYVRLLSPGGAIVAFLAIFVVSAIVFQLRSEIPPWQDGAPSDILNGVLIWMVCLVSFIMAAVTRHDPVRSLVWFAGSAALGLVALDELFAVHEYAAKLRDDDDPKILMALGAGFALAVLIRVQRIRGTPYWLLLCGYLFHLAYLLSDLGDGDFFQIRYVDDQSLRGIEEALEFTAMLLYLPAFLLVALEEFALGPRRNIQDDRPREAPRPRVPLQPIPEPGYDTVALRRLWARHVSR
jgi:hypothetical protein